MDHTSFINFFEDLAKSHKDLRHEEDFPGSPTGKRQSFFRANGEEELQQSDNTQVDFPLMLLRPYTGQLSSSDAHLVDDLMYGSFDIRMKVDNLLSFSEIEDKRQQCKRIGFVIIAEMNRLYLDEGRCGPIPDFDVNTVRYEFIGPVNNAQYGCRFSWTFKDRAFSINEIDLDEEFQRD